MIDKLLLKIRERFRFTAAEEDLLRAAMGEASDYQRGSVMIPEGKRLGYSTLLVEGFAARATMLPDGEAQIIQVNIAGDFVDMHSYPLEWLDHDIVALTRCKMVKLPHENITAMIEQDPRLVRIFWFATMVDAAINREWVVSLGRRRAVARLAHLFCEMFYRLRVVDLVGSGNSYDFPIPQAEVANAVGLTPVHVNRMLRELRERDLCTFRDGRVVIQDLAGLEELADFDPKYLFLQPRSA